MVTLIWTEEARLWIREIHTYIFSDNPAAAKRTVVAIRQKAKMVEAFPKAGYTLEHEYGDLEIRILLYGHYRIAYLLKNEKTAYVLGIFHGALDIGRHLRIPSEAI